MNLNKHKHSKGNIIGLICVGAAILALFGLALSRTNDDHAKPNPSSTEDDHPKTNALNTNDEHAAANSLSEKDDHPRTNALSANDDHSKPIPLSTETQHATPKSLSANRDDATQDALSKKDDHTNPKPSNTNDHVKVATGNSLSGKGDELPMRDSLAGQTEQKLKITVHSPHPEPRQRDASVVIAASASVSDLRATLVAQGVTVERLSFGKKIMTDQMLLSHVGIAEGAVIQNGPWPGYVSGEKAKEILSQKNAKQDAHKNVLLLGGDHHGARRKRNGWHNGIVCLNGNAEYIRLQHHEVAVHCDFNKLEEMQRLAKTFEETFDLIVFDWSAWKFAEFNEGHLSAIRKMLKKGGEFIWELDSDNPAELRLTETPEGYVKNYKKGFDGTELRHDFAFDLAPDHRDKRTGERADVPHKAEIREMVLTNNRTLLDKMEVHFSQVDVENNFKYEDRRPEHHRERLGCTYDVMICTK